MLPDEEVVDGDIGKLGLGSIWSQHSEPVLRGDHIIWVNGGLSQVQSVQELLELFRGQGVDVLPHHWSFSLVTVRSGPAKFTLSTVITWKVPYNTERTACCQSWVYLWTVFQHETVNHSPVHLQVWLKNLVGHLSLSSTFLSLYGPPQGLESTRTVVQLPLPDRDPHTLAGSEPRAGQHCLDRMPCTVQQTRGNWPSAGSKQSNKDRRPSPSAIIIFHASFPPVSRDKSVWRWTFSRNAVN